MYDGYLYLRFESIFIHLKIAPTICLLYIVVTETIFSVQYRTTINYFLLKPKSRASLSKKMALQWE